MSKIGIKELASIAGVSTASVSRALSNPSRVSERMRKRVEDAAKQSGYRPNRLGSSLRTARSNNIIAVIPDITDTFVSGVIQSLERTAMQRGYSVLLGNTNGLREMELTYGSMVRSQQADGMIVFSHRLPFTDEEINHPGFTLPPLVNSCEIIEAKGVDLSSIPFISIDNTQAGKDITNHLVSLGHRDIAVITGNLGTPSATQRLNGYKRAFREANIEVNEELIFEGKYTLESGVAITQQILLKKNRPTAIFCMCDETAMGAITALRERGYDVPKDFSVVGIDDIRFAKYHSPALTTIAQPVQEIGRLCVDMLLDLIEGNPIDRPTRTLKHTMEIRGSTRAIT